MKLKTVKDLLFAYINDNNGHINYEDATKLILNSFPDSKWKKAHWSWYKTQITSDKGKYFNCFSEIIKNNISNRKTSISNQVISLSQEFKQNRIQGQTNHEFKNYSKDVEQTIAMALGKVCHHIHPEIIKKIAESNIEFINDFKPICGNLNLDTFFYNASDCVFPGVRRNINKEKIENWKNNICIEDYMILNDNTFPRHIWTFLSMNKHYDGTTWKKSGLNQFELAHIFGHKTDEKKLEKKVFKRYDETKDPFALFTSASNVILIPNGLMKPTDKFESIKIAFYKRHFDLYGNNLFAENDFNESFVPNWYSKIEWLKPNLPENWEERIDNLLNYRKKVLLNKYNASR